MRPGAESARVLALAAAVLAVPAPSLAQPVVPSPPSPTSAILWAHDGIAVTRFEIRVDRATVATVQPVEPSPDGQYATPLPLLTPGLRTLAVAACNDYGCAESEPLTVQVVSGPIRWWLPWSMPRK
jgi:hypothetical protein